MNWGNIRLFSRHFWRSVLTFKSFYALYLIFILLAAYAAVSGIQNHLAQNEIRSTHQAKARQSWEANPDKHPHRMAHFGTFAFRLTPALGIFDYGLESYTGSTVFLEAHRQNSVNFSDATFSTGILRFGELSLALLLQLVLPLLLFFIGFSSVAADKENGTLKILRSQGAGWLEILLGKSLGLFKIALAFVVPVLLTVIVASLVLDGTAHDFLWVRLLIISLGYLAFLWIVSIVTVVVSARSNSPKNALIRLLGIWLLLAILLPKSAQALGNYWYPTPTKLAFHSAIEKEEIQKGDSHNPDDPHYNQLRDSVLAVHKVADVADLPFNYSGFIMREGEKISSTLYKEHHADLLDTYQNQNKITRLLAFVNPYLAIKQLSMTLSGTDFVSYIDFQEQADGYRYELAQKMNALQMEYIKPNVSSSEGKVNVVGHQHWEEFPDFQHQPITFGISFREALPAIISMTLWLLFAFWFLVVTSKKAKAV